MTLLVPASPTRSFECVVDGRIITGFEYCGEPCVSEAMLGVALQIPTREWTAHIDTLIQEGWLVPGRHFHGSHIRALTPRGIVCAAFKAHKVKIADWAETLDSRVFGPSVADAVAIFEFEGAPIRAVTVEGRRLVPAAEQGRALGYARDGAAFVESVREWIDQGELRSDEHVVRLEGEALKRVKELNTETVSSRAASLIMLTEQGVIRAALLAGGPKALRFRDYATGVMFNVLTTGAHVERGAADPSALPRTPMEVTAYDRETRLYAGAMMRSGRKSDAADYMRSREQARGLFLSGPTTPTAQPSTQTQLPFAPVTDSPPAAPTPKPDGDDWPGFVLAWAAKHGDRVVATSDLLRIRGFVEVESENAAGLAVKLGKLLGERADTVVAGYKILHRHSTIRGWSLKKMP